jgi:hypothetical protein
MKIKKGLWDFKKPYFDRPNNRNAERNHRSILAFGNEELVKYCILSAFVCSKQDKEMHSKYNT